MTRPRMARDRDGFPSLPPTPIGFKIWFAFCALLGLGFLGLIVWAVVALVNHFTT